MKRQDIIANLENGQGDANYIADAIIRDRALVKDAIRGISSDNPRVKFGCAKVLRIISEIRPEMLYGEFDFFVGLLDEENRIIRWNAMDVLANLAVVDTDRKFDRIFDNYFGLLKDESMVSAAHVIDNSAMIAGAKPQLVERITDEILKIEDIQRNSECRNILAGKAISSFEAYFDLIRKRDAVISFVERQLKCTRPATRTKAENFMKRRAGQKASKPARTKA